MPETEDQLKASVVILTRNRPKQLQKCYIHLLHQTIKSFETIVVDNSTTDETERLSPRLEGIRYTRCSTELGAQPRLRNIGIEMSKGEIVAFLDDDGFAEPQWLESLAECYQDPKVGAAGGRIIQGDLAPLNVKVGRLRMIGGVEGNWNFVGPNVLSVDHLQGTNMSFRRSVLQQIGGWDETYCGGYATYEEPDVCIRVRKAGYKILFNPKAAVVHGEEEREGSFGRSVNESPMLAYYTGRNGTYMYLKNFGLRPLPFLAAFVFNPAIEILRCLFGSATKPSLRKLNVNGIYGSCLHVLGVLVGVYLSIKNLARIPSFGTKS
jgi:GT2 family glycosyltransferase